LGVQQESRAEHETGAGGHGRWALFRDELGWARRGALRHFAARLPRGPKITRTAAGLLINK
jgi:hypothetical protein